MTQCSKLIRFSIIYLILINLFIGCNSKSEEIVPYAYVNFTIDMQDPDYLDLLNVGGKVILKNEGYNDNGIIIYHSGIDEFTAFDATCTNEVSDCAVEGSANSIISAICPCCKSEFELMYGSVLKAPAKHSLHQYNVLYNGITLRIFN